MPIGPAGLTIEGAAAVLDLTDDGVATGSTVATLALRLDGR
jgi:hypothetical protein